MSGPFWRDVRTLLTARQQTLGYLVALGALGLGIDLLCARVVDELPSFSAFARHEYDADVTWRAFAALGGSSVLAWAVVLASIPVAAALSAWLRACYLVALTEGRYAVQAPRRTVARLAVYWLLYLVFELGLTGVGRDVSSGLALLLELAATPVWLFSEYAIVLDDLPFPRAVMRSLAMFRVRTRASIGAVFGLLLVALLVTIAFDRGFVDSGHVQPTYLVAWALAGALLTFASDVVLVTLYRQTRFSAGGSAGSQEASSTSTPSD